MLRRNLDLVCCHLYLLKIFEDSSTGTWLLWSMHLHLCLESWLPRMQSLTRDLKLWVTYFNWKLLGRDLGYPQMAFRVSTPASQTMNQPSKAFPPWLLYHLCLCFPFLHCNQYNHINVLSASMALQSTFFSCSLHSYTSHSPYPLDPLPWQIFINYPQLGQRFSNTWHFSTLMLHQHQ